MVASGARVVAAADRFPALWLPSTLRDKVWLGTVGYKSAPGRWMLLPQAQRSSNMFSVRCGAVGTVVVALWYHECHGD
jgi:hypothetical protein